MTTTQQLTPEWVLQILEDHKHRTELAAMIKEIQEELSTKKQIIPKKPFK